MNSLLFAISRVSARCPSLAKRTLCMTPQRYNKQFEPPYLDVGGPEVPEYSLLNVQMKGYDFTVLEHYAKWVHHTALNMGIDVEDTWAAPCQNLHIKTFKPNTSNIEAEYNLQVYERTVQLADLSSVLAPLFIEVIQAGLPEGVHLTVQEHMPEHTQVRYVPDLELKDLRKQLDDLGGPSKASRK